MSLRGGALRQAQCKLRDDEASPWRRGDTISPFAKRGKLKEQLPSTEGSAGVLYFIASSKEIAVSGNVFIIC